MDVSRRYVFSFVVAALTVAVATACGPFPALPPLDPDADADADADTPQPSLYVFAKKVQVGGIAESSQSARAVAAEPGRVFIGTPIYTAPAGGVVGVFAKRGSDWIAAPSGSGSGQVADAHFGASLAIRGDTMLVAAHQQPQDSTHKAGMVYVFKREGAAWEPSVTLGAVHRNPYGLWGLGATATTNATRIVAGKAHTGDPSTPGEIDVFERIGSTWVAQPPVTVPAGFGAIVATDGDVIATGDGVIATGDGSEVIILTKTGTDWSESSRLTGAPGSGFGSTLALRERFLFVGAPNYNDTGAVYVYELVDSTWTERARLTPAGPNTVGGKFGAAIDFAAGRLLVGAPETNGMTGAAYLFELLGDTWFQHPRLTSLDYVPLDTFGNSVSVASDASTFVIGALGRQEAYIYERVDP